MNGQAITFDFHNTLASCPEWFELEVRHLPSSFLRWWSDRDGRQLEPAHTRRGRRPLPAAASRDHRAWERADRRSLPRTRFWRHADCRCLKMTCGLVSQISCVGRWPEQRRFQERSPPCGRSTRPGYPSASSPARSITRFWSGPWNPSAFATHFDVVITSASAGFYKSRAELYVHAAELLGATPERMVHVGDSFRFDVAGASRAGMGTVWLRGDRIRA